MVLGSLLVIALWMVTDPDNNIITHLPFGASTIATLTILLKSVLYVTMLHISAISVTDYLKLKDLSIKAMETPEGAGRVFMGVGLIFIAIALVIYAAVRF